MYSKKKKKEGEPVVSFSKRLDDSKHLSHGRSGSRCVERLVGRVVEVDEETVVAYQPPLLFGVEVGAHVVHDLYSIPLCVN